MPVASPPRGRTASGVSLLLVGVLSVQLGAGLAKSLFPVAGPGGTVWLRLLFAAVVLAVLFPPSRLPWPLSRLGWSREAAVAVVGFGLVLGGMNWSFYEAIDRIPLGVAVALEFTGPLVLSLALSRRVVDVLWALLAAAGLLLLTLDPFGTSESPSGPLDPVGVVLALVAGLFWAGYILASRRVGNLVPGTKGLAGALVVAALVTTPVGLSTGTVLLDSRILLIGLGVALLSSALPYATELEALRRLPARVFGVLLSTEPVAAALVGLLVLGEVLDAWQWGAVALIFVASLGVTLTARDPEDAPRGEPALDP